MIISFDKYNMASNRKKQDEKNLKVLRNLVSQSVNKRCFDCSQRGPTYVNVTIGSFVCTSCSGLLRGLTPPHRVKSISMATFTTEEVESIKSKGNEYCRKVWLALYDSNHVQDTKDVNNVRDFMVGKYEKKQYYMEPSAALRNSSSHSPTFPSAKEDENGKILRHPVPNSSLTSSSSSASSQARINRPTNSTSVITLPDPFGPPPNSHRPQQEQLHHHHEQQQQFSFANFDDNPIFNSAPITSTAMTTSASFPSNLKPGPAPEDKYAALKDLDFLMKMQQESQSPGFEGDSGKNSRKRESNGSLNPFNNSNLHNPFTSGLMQQGEGHSSSSPWDNSNAWATLPTSRSMPFPTKTWNGTGHLAVSPGKSSNPFL